MSGWARSDRSKYRSVFPAPLDDLTHKLHIKASTSTSKRLEKGISLLEEALAKCDTDDAYKSTLELYASHVQTQRTDIAGLRAELERAKKPTIDYGNKIHALESNLAEKEGECASLRSRIKQLETQLQSSEKSIDACCSQLSEERQWRKTAMECLRDELSLAKETAGLVSTVQEKKTVDKRCKNNTSPRKLTKKNLEENDRPRSAPPQRPLENTSEESVLDETEEEVTRNCSGGDGDDGTVVERKNKRQDRNNEWSLDITAVSAVLSR